MAPKRKAPAGIKKTKKTKKDKKKIGPALKASASPVDPDNKQTLAAAAAAMTKKKTKIMVDEEISPAAADIVVPVDAETEEEHEELTAPKKKENDNDNNNDDNDDDEMLPSEDLKKLPPASNTVAIIVEASKECNSFKTRTTKVEEELKKAIPGVIIKVNPEKPRKGCFEVRGEDGTLYISCLNMPRPFSKMKNIDLDKEIEAIVSKMK